MHPSRLRTLSHLRQVIQHARARPLAFKHAGCDLKLPHMSSHLSARLQSIQVKQAGPRYLTTKQHFNMPDLPARCSGTAPRHAGCFLGTFPTHPCFAALLLNSHCRIPVNLRMQQMSQPDLIFGRPTASDLPASDNLENNNHQTGAMCLPADGSDSALAIHHRNTLHLQNARTDFERDAAV